MARSRGFYGCCRAWVEGLCWICSWWCQGPIIITNSMFPIPLWLMPSPTLQVAKVPCASAQQVRLGYLEETGHLEAGTVDGQAGKFVPSWKKNCSRQTWTTFYRMKLGWKIPLTNYDYQAASGEVISLPYVSPRNLFQYLLEKHPDVVVGGSMCPLQRASLLEAFWAGFKLENPDHLVYREHRDNLQNIIPLYYHGDEGRGKRRGNTVVVSCESPIGLSTSSSSQLLGSRKRKRTCKCQPPVQLQNQYGVATQAIPSRLESSLKSQVTSTTGHSFMQHWCLFVIPSVYHHAHPDLLKSLMEIIANDFRSLFYEGITVNGKNYCIAVCGHKGDLKWFTKVGNLTRSYEHKGRVRNLQCCHECLAGSDQVPWEDISQNPSWATTCFQARPWATPPSFARVPAFPLSPERLLRKDPFHICKVGIFRDHVGSSICYMVHCGLFGGGNFETRLDNAHGACRLYTKTIGVSPALRSFSRNLLMYQNFSQYPWINCKGSDTMLCLRWLCVQCVAFDNDSHQNGADREYLRLIKATSEAAVAIFSLLNSHGLFLERKCLVTLYAEITRYINGFMVLANKTLNNPAFNLWGIKPKIHLLKHMALEVHQLLQTGADYGLSFNSQNCEVNEDYIGRVCRLSRRIDSRLLCRRVIQSSFLKGAILHRRWKLRN